VIFKIKIQLHSRYAKVRCMLSTAFKYSSSAFLSEDQFRGLAVQIYINKKGPTWAVVYGFKSVWSNSVHSERI